MRLARPYPQLELIIRACQRALTLAILATGAIGCRGMPNALGSDRRTARSNADALFESLADRFDNVQRAPKFFQARSKLGRYALSPSGVYGDTSVWTSAGADSTRTLTLSGTHTATGYTFTPRASVPAPSVTGDSRHVIRLRRRADSEYEWNTAVEHAIGSVRGNDIATALTAFLGSAEQATDSRIRIDNQTLFPRTTRVLGELFSLDTVRVTPQIDGSAGVVVRFHLDPDRIKATRPNFAKYLEKYVEPARYRLRLQDGRGAIWLDVAGSNNRFTLSYRVHNGTLLALAGVPRPLPDSLQIAVDFSAKFMIFRVGVSRLIGDFVFQRRDDERGWMMHFRHEPDWHFPLAVNNLIRTSLRHPFSREGIAVRVAIRDRAGPQTLLTREVTGAVQESAIVRWLGGLGNSAMNDFAGKAEVEENRYAFEVLSALRADFVAVLAAGE